MIRAEEQERLELAHKLKSVEVGLVISGFACAVMSAVALVLLLINNFGQDCRTDRRSIEIGHSMVVAGCPK